MNIKHLLPLVIAVIAGLGIVYAMQPPSHSATVQIKIPSNLSDIAQVGKNKFENNCMACHGKNATGTGNGPPLVHKIYEPGHHSDQSFYRAVANGVRRHHWPYGNMPPLQSVPEDDVTAIIKYVRELQQANGIF